jgi:hypothetical protein
MSWFVEILTFTEIVVLANYIILLIINFQNNSLTSSTEKFQSCARSI